mgnify:CR=1 FL=1
MGVSAPAQTGGGLRRAGTFAAATGLLHLVLIQPNHPDAMAWGALLVLPLELPALLLGLLALPHGGAASRALRAALAGTLTLIAALKLADHASFTALGRGFNPVADLALVSAALRLTAGSLGPVAAAALTAGLVLAVAALAAALWWATGVWARPQLPRRPALAAGAGALGAVGIAAAEIGHAMGRWSLPVAPPGAAFTARVGVERVRMARETLADLRAFAEAARADPYAGAAPLFDRLDRDLLVIFVESYGRASLDVPRYAPRTRATLGAAQAALEERGLAMRSGWLSAPTQGGQSWLSHATLATGLRIDGQTRYSAALASGRQTLYDLAGAAGLHAAAVMPAITLEWPEGIALGFETILAAEDLEYAGPPFNWVTMPDQYTLTALDRELRDGPDGRPLVAQVALVSSHAPWVPVPELVPWEEVGDGAVFSDMARAGDPPEVVWRDRDRVRTQYGRAVDYALRTVFAWAARQGDDPPLLLVLGDHQAAPFVALEDRSDVPAHLIGPPDLVAQAAAWGWAEGLVPAPDAAVEGMEVMRDRLLAATSTGGPAREGGARGAVARAGEGAAP